MGIGPRNSPHNSKDSANLSVMMRLVAHEVSPTRCGFWLHEGLYVMLGMHVAIMLCKVKRQLFWLKVNGP